MTHVHRDHPHVKRFADEIRGIKTSMLTTIDLDGQLKSRPMLAQKTDFDGYLWFITHTADEKVHEIQKDNRVCVTYSDASRQLWVFFSGTAEIISNEEKVKEFWQPDMKSWLDSHDNKNDEEKMALIKVTVKKGEFWESNRGVMLNLIEWVASAATGSDGHPVEHEKIEFTD